ncbi:MAG: thioredoxin family protein [Phycisphaerales bacterium]
MNRILTAAVIVSAMIGWSSATGYANCGTCDGDQCEDHASAAEVGKPAPRFTATDARGNTYDLAALTKQGKIVVLEWFNPGCPFVQKHYAKGSTMNDLAKKYAGKDVVWLAVSSTHDLAADAVVKAAEQWSINHPVLMDQTGKIGRMYGAKTTPDMFIISKEGVLVYSGAIDNDPTAGAPKTGDDAINYVDQALTELLAGKAVTTARTRAYGCSVNYAKEQANASAPGSKVDHATVACGCEGGGTDKPKEKDKDKGKAA